VDRRTGERCEIELCDYCADRRERSIWRRFEPDGWDWPTSEAVQR